MLISVYLEPYVVDIIRCYGEPSDVINRMLDGAFSGDYDVFDKPSAGPRTQEAYRIEVDVTNENYIELMNSFPVNSPRTSLRRFVHWFIDNEMPEQLGWEVCNEYLSKEKNRVRKLLRNIESCSQTLKKYLPRVTDNSLESVDVILHEVAKIRSKI